MSQRQSLASRSNSRLSIQFESSTRHSESNPPRIAPLVPTPIYDTYWYFAAERQHIFFRRLEGRPPPWTHDRILLDYKFTNVYRASDRVSQYLIRNVIYRPDLPSSNNEVFFRTLLFKVFNRIETWQLLEREVGALTWENFDFDRYDSLLSAVMERGKRIYSAAYIMPSAQIFGHVRKHRNHLALINSMIRDGLPGQLSDAPSLQHAFRLLLKYPSIGEFLAFQFAIDLNYSQMAEFSEMDYVVAGPGAVSGIGKCFSDRSDWSNERIIRFMADRQDLEFARLGLSFPRLGRRPLQLIDCQNLFCEVDKYARVYHPEFNVKGTRSQIKQRFRPNSGPIDYWFPPKWKITDIRSQTVRSRKR